MDLTTADKRIRRTHRLLREAFIEVVAEMGYEAVRVEDIIVRADIGRTTFYAHFDDKRDLLQHVADTFDARYKRDLSRIISEPDAYNTLAAVEDMFVQFKKNATFFRLALESRDVPVFQDLVYVAVHELMSSLFARQIEVFELTPKLPLHLIVEHAVGGYLALAKWWLSEGFRVYSAAEMAQVFDDLNVSGRGAVMGLGVKS